MRKVVATLGLLLGACGGDDGETPALRLGCETSCRLLFECGDLFRDPSRVPSCTEGCLDGLSGADTACREATEDLGTCADGLDCDALGEGACDEASRAVSIACSDEPLPDGAVPGVDAGPDSCIAGTCETLEKNCGVVDDGCGGTLVCGTCTAPNSCGGGGVENVCGCTPTTCEAEGAACGSIPDGCGFVATCDVCPGDDYCGAETPNQCGCVPAGNIGPIAGTLASNNVGAGTIAWIMTDRVFADDGTDGELRLGYAEAEELVSTDVSQLLVVQGYGLQVPDRATIEGIEVLVDRRALSGVGILDHTVSLVKRSNVGEANRATGGVWPIEQATVTYGGGEDLWDTTWTPEDLNRPDFGVAFGVQYDGGGGTDFALVDQVTVRVHFAVDCP